MFKFLFKKRTEDIQAAQLYSQVLAQSRKADFFGAGRFEDSYDGRVDLLSLNLGLIIHNLRRFDAHGQRLGQALYDVMVEDFNIALREEGLADTGIKRRIKPMIAFFYGRLSALSQALSEEQDLGVFVKMRVLGQGEERTVDSDFAVHFADYLQHNHAKLSQVSLDTLENAKFEFEPLKGK